VAPSTFTSDGVQLPTGPGSAQVPSSRGVDFGVRSSRLSPSLQHEARASRRSAARTAPAREALPQLLQHLGARRVLRAQPRRGEQTEREPRPAVRLGALRERWPAAGQKDVRERGQRSEPQERQQAVHAGRREDAVRMVWSRPTGPLHVSE
jgi:hypothetical protein